MDIVKYDLAMRNGWCLWDSKWYCSDCMAASTINSEGVRVI